MIFHVTSHVASSEVFLFGPPAECGRHSPAARCSTHRREMDDLDAGICDLPTELMALILSHVDGVDTRVALACVSRTWRNAARLPESRPARYDSMLLRVLRESCPAIKARWPESQAPGAWVTMEDDRVVRLYVSSYPRPLLAVPAVIGQFTSLTVLTLRGHDQLTSLPAEIGQLVSLVELDLGGNQLTSLPSEIGQLTSLTELWLSLNQLTSLPAAIRELRAAGCDVWLDDGVTFDE